MRERLYEICRLLVRMPGAGCAFCCWQNNLQGVIAGASDRKDECSLADIGIGSGKRSSGSRGKTAIAGCCALKIRESRIQTICCEALNRRPAGDGAIDRRRGISARATLSCRRGRNGVLCCSHVQGARRAIMIYILRDRNLERAGVHVVRRSESIRCESRAVFRH